MPLRLQFVPYRRPLAIPLRTARGTWFEREGVLLRLEASDGSVGYGEVAPLPDFGSESLEEARGFLQQLGSSVEEEALSRVPASLPCCRFALGSALWMLETPEIDYRLRNCALLPSGEAAFEALGEFSRAGFHDFKLKIGMAGLNEELALVNGLLSLLPVKARLRLDANASLGPEELEHWCACLADEAAIAFIEQPLGVGREALAGRVAQKARIRIALDESIASGEDLRGVLADLAWTGPIVLKSSVLGFPHDQLSLLRASPCQPIFSSAFETAIGLHSVLRVGATAGSTEAVGFGTIGYFADELSGYSNSAVLASERVGAELFERIWGTVCDEFVLN